MVEFFDSFISQACDDKRFATTCTKFSHSLHHYTESNLET